MILPNFVRSNFVSRLRPWLLEEPELELELGLLALHGCAKNLALDPSALNTLIEDSSLFEFKQMEVGELCVQVRPWSSPSILVEVRGLHATLAHRVTNKLQHAHKHSATKKKNEMIASLDPEGASLHDAIVRLLARDILGDQLVTSWADAAVSCSHLKIQDILLELQLPEKSHASCLLAVEDFSINSPNLHGDSLFRKLFNSLFVLGKRSELDISCGMIKVGIKENDQIKWITSLLGLSAHAELIGFCLLSNCIHVPLIMMNFSPEDIPILMLILDAFSSKDHSVLRTGKELWSIASFKTRYLMRGVRYSLQSVVEMVLLWSRYVYTYGSLLTLAGNSTEASLKKIVGKHSIDQKMFIRAKHQLNLIFELEEKLPAQLVVQGRRVARNKKFHVLTDLKETRGLFSTLFRHILILFGFLWKMVFFFQSVMHYSIGKVLNLNFVIQRSTTLGGVCSFCVNMDEVFITYSHSTSVHFSISKRVKWEDKLNLPSLRLFFSKLSFFSETDEAKISYFWALHEIKLSLSASLPIPLDHDLIMNRNHSSKAVHVESFDESKVILWVDPTSLHHTQEICDDDSLKPFVVILGNNIRDLRSNWNKIREKHEANALHMGEAVLLCELKYFLANPYLKNGACGLWKYNLNIGKISLDLDYLSILSASLMFRLLEDPSQLMTSAGSTPSLPCTSDIVDKIGINMDNVVEFYVNKYVDSILNMIPDMNILMGAVFAGLCIRVSFEQGSLGLNKKDVSTVISEGNNCNWFEIDIGNSEFAMWPASKTVLFATTGELFFDEGPLEYFWLMEPQICDSHQGGNENENFFSHERITLNACLRSNIFNVLSGFELAKHSHFVEPISITTKVSICRDYHHTFFATNDIVSVAFCALLSRATVLFYMDELKNIFQLIEGMLLEVAASYNNITSVGTSRDGSIETSYVMNLNSKKLLIRANFELESVDFILGESRKSPNARTSKFDGLSNRNSSLHKKETSGFDVHNFLGFGLGFCIQSSCIKLTLEADSCDMLVDLSGFQAVLLDLRSLMIISNDMLQMKEILLESSKRSYCFDLAHCRLKSLVRFLSVILGCPNPGNAIHSLLSANCQTSFEIEESCCRDEIQNSLEESDLIYESCNVHTADNLEPASGCSFVIVVELGDIIVSENHDALLFKRVNQTSKLKIKIFSGEGHREIVCKIKGGFIFIEAIALTKFLQCFQIYSSLIASFPSRVALASRESSISNISRNNLVSPNSPSSIELVIASVSSASSSETQKATQWSFIDALTIRLAQFSVTFAVAGCSGKAKELIIEVDVLLRLCFGRKIAVNLHHLSVFTQDWHKITFNEIVEKQMVHFCSKTSVDSVIQVISELPCNQGSDYASSGPSMPHPTSNNELKIYTPDSSYHKHCVLNHLFGSATIVKIDLEGDRLAVEFYSNWGGKGYISGLNLMIQLSEMQMFLYLYALFSELFPVDAYDCKKQNVSSRDSGWSVASDHKIPDGAIVTIQDLQQHMYFAVEHADTKYHLVGTLHYFLVGERALFKVRYHKRWGSRMPSMSFLSLFAKNDKGEPLCMNFNPGSGFVGISGCDGNVSSLWQTFQCDFQHYEDDDDFKTETTARKAFHLMNMKSDSAVAFVDGMPEFVKKPGNQFKVKVFDDYVLAKGIAGHLFKSDEDACDEHHKSSGSNTERSGIHANLPHINIRVDNAKMTIFHEVSDVDDQLPLFQFCLDNIAILGQVLLTKLRVISSFNAVLRQFDARVNAWREFIAPVEFCLYYRSRFSQLESFVEHHGIPVHFFLRMSQLDILLTEVSLDVLLYLIGELDLAGPFAVRRLVIFPNSCKLENCTDLTVHYQFPKNQNVVLSPGQSSTVLLRFAPLAEQLPFSESTVSICLSDNGGFSTSPIAISLSNTCFFAWRSRILSPNDSRKYPGPFVVVDASLNNEEGLSLAISPLLRIHNESRFPLELCFRRPEESRTESASILLEHGDSVDDSRAAFDALDLNGGSKRTLMSLSLGNFFLSLKPQITEHIKNYENHISLLWSEEIKGGKAMRISGIFEKLNYRFRKAFSVDSSKSLFSMVSCSITTMEGQHISNLYFLIRTIGKDVPLMQPQNHGDRNKATSSPVAMQVQKEIFIYPTIQFHNLLQSEIIVLLSEDHSDMHNVEEFVNFGKQATIPCQSSAYFYANPANIYFRITLNAYNSTSKPINSVACVKKLEKRQNDAHFIDMELDFASGVYFAILRLSSSDRGLLEVTIFTRYTLQNNSELTLFCSASSQKSDPRAQTEIEMHSSDVPPQLGCLLPPRSMKSWFLKSNKVFIKLLEDNASMKLLDLDILTGLTELSLEVADRVGINRVAKLGVSLQPSVNQVSVPAQVVSFVPRFIIANESKESIAVRQCYLQDELNEDTFVKSKQRMPLHLRNRAIKERENSLIDSVLKWHTNRNDNSQIFVQFSIKEAGYWSGPICIASLGRFFLKFKRHSANSSKKLTQFAVAHIVEEGSSLIIYFHMPPDISPPYRIENFLQGVSIQYYQKDLAESEILPAGSSAEYAWDDLSLPHKLIVEILDFHLLREININKVCKWRPIFNTRQHRGMLLQLPLNKQVENDQGTSKELREEEIFKLGFEVYAEGSTRILRFCDSSNRMERIVALASANFQVRISSFAVHLLEKNKQIDDVSLNEPLNYSDIIVARLGNVALDSLSTRHCKYNFLKVQSFTVDEKWQGAPFASMVRRSQLHDFGANMNILQVVFILQMTNSKVKQVKYSSIIIQPIDLKIDEETLMKLVPFYRSSYSNSRKQSQQFYFKHFEIHPIKITASFLPGNQYLSYNSTEETLRSFLHSVLKLPSIKNVILELNGVLLTHALVTSRELLIKCAQHYSWYLIRAIYITKGSSLLPPAFVSIFDDTAASSLDVFFDPSDGSISLPGLTVGMFKIISKCINAEGFSGTKRYFGDLGKTMKTAGSNVLFAILTEISDNVLRGAETNGFKGLVTGFHQGILRFAMEPTLLGAAVMEGGPDRKSKLDRNPGVDELYIEGYLQAMLDVMYKLEYLHVRVIDNQVHLKNLPPNSSVINEILENVKSFLVSKALLKGDTTSSRPLRHLRSENDWKLGPTVLTLCEHLLVSFTIRILRKQANRFVPAINIKWRGKEESNTEGDASQEQKHSRTWAVASFFLSGMIAYVDGRLCRHIPNPLARRIVSGFLLSFLDKNYGQ